MAKQEEQKHKSFKNTTFRKDYNPSFDEFLKSHFKVFGKADIGNAFKAVTGKDLSPADKKAVENYKDNGDAKPAAEKSSNSDSGKSE